MMPKFDDDMVKLEERLKFVEEEHRNDLKKVEEAIANEAKGDFLDDTDVNHGTVVFYASGASDGEQYMRDFMVDMYFKDQDTRDAAGIALYNIATQIADSGSASVMLTYVGWVSRGRNMIALSNIVGLNTNVSPPDLFLKSQEADIEIDTDKMADGDVVSLEGVERVF
jgi:hypothetical protein